MQRVGIHLGVEHVSVVTVDSHDRIVDSLVLPAPSGCKSWQYHESDIKELISLISQRIQIRGRTIAVSLPAATLFCRRVDYPANQPHSEDSLRYAVEPVLPIALEDIHIVLANVASEQAMVIAVPDRPWAQVLRSFDLSGWICPRALCDAVALTCLPDVLPCEFVGTMILVAFDSHVGVISILQEGHIIAVRPLAIAGDLSPTWLAAQLDRTWNSCTNLQQKPSIRLVVPGKLLNRFDNWLDQHDIEPIVLENLLPEGATCSLEGAFALGAARSLHLAGKNIVNLRTGKLTSSTIRRKTATVLLAHSVAAAIIMLLTAIGLIYRGYHYQNLAKQSQLAIHETWATLYPDTDFPVDVYSRLISEHARELGIRTADKKLPEHAAALDILRQMVEALPRDIPIRVRRLELEGEVSVIVGEARSHGEVEGIASKLAHIQGLTVLPSRTERTSTGTVKFTLRFEKKVA